MYIRLTAIKDTVTTPICLATKKAVPQKKEQVAVDALNRLRMNGRKKRSRRAVIRHDGIRGKTEVIDGYGWEIFEIQEIVDYANGSQLLIV